MSKDSESSSAARRKRMRTISLASMVLVISMFVLLTYRNSEFAGKSLDSNLETHALKKDFSAHSMDPSREYPAIVFLPMRYSRLYMLGGIGHWYHFMEFLLPYLDDAAVYVEDYYASHINNTLSRLEKPPTTKEEWELIRLDLPPLYIIFREEEALQDASAFSLFMLSVLLSRGLPNEIIFGYSTKSTREDVNFPWGEASSSSRAVREALVEKAKKEGAFNVSRVIKDFVPIKVYRAPPVSLADWTARYQSFADSHRRSSDIAGRREDDEPEPTVISDISGEFLRDSESSFLNAVEDLGVASSDYNLLPLQRRLDQNDEDQGSVGLGGGTVGDGDAEWSLLTMEELAAELNGVTSSYSPNSEQVYSRRNTSASAATDIAPSHPITAGHASHDTSSRRQYLYQLPVRGSLRVRALFEVGFNRVNSKDLISLSLAFHVDTARYTMSRICGISSYNDYFYDGKPAQLFNEPFYSVFLKHSEDGAPTESSNSVDSNLEVDTDGNGKGEEVRGEANEKDDNEEEVEEEQKEGEKEELGEVDLSTRVSHSVFLEGEQEELEEGEVLSSTEDAESMTVDNPYIDASSTVAEAEGSSSGSSDPVPLAASATTGYTAIPRNLGISRLIMQAYDTTASQSLIMREFTNDEERKLWLLLQQFHRMHTFLAHMRLKDRNTFSMPIFPPIFFANDSLFDSQALLDLQSRRVDVDRLRPDAGGTGAFQDLNRLRNLRKRDFETETEIEIETHTHTGCTDSNSESSSSSIGGIGRERAREEMREERGMTREGVKEAGSDASRGPAVSITQSQESKKVQERSRRRAGVADTGHIGSSSSSKRTQRNANRRTLIADADSAVLEPKPKKVLVYQRDKSRKLLHLDHILRTLDDRLNTVAAAGNPGLYSAVADRSIVPLSAVPAGATGESLSARSTEGPEVIELSEGIEDRDRDGDAELYTGEDTEREEVDTGLASRQLKTAQATPRKSRSSTRPTNAAGATAGAAGGAAADGTASKTSPSQRNAAHSGSSSGKAWEVELVMHSNDRPPCELIRMIAQATILVTPHGFQNVLLMFQPVDSMLSEVYPRFYYAPHVFGRLQAILRGGVADLTTVESDPEPNSEPESGGSEDDSEPLGASNNSALPTEDTATTTTTTTTSAVAASGLVSKSDGLNFDEGGDSVSDFSNNFSGSRSMNISSSSSNNNNINSSSSSGVDSVDGSSKTNVEQHKMDPELIEALNGMMSIVDKKKVTTEEMRNNVGLLLLPSQAERSLMAEESKPTMLMTKIIEICVEWGIFRDDMWVSGSALGRHVSRMQNVEMSDAHIERIAQYANEFL